MKRRIVKKNQKTSRPNRRAGQEATVANSQSMSSENTVPQAIGPDVEIKTDIDYDIDIDYNLNMELDPLKSIGYDDSFSSSEPITPGFQKLQFETSPTSLIKILQSPDTRLRKTKLSAQDKENSQPQTKKRNVSRRKPSHDDTNEGSTSDDSSEESNKSVKFVECGGSSGPSRNAKILKVLNDGSEEEDEDGAASDDDDVRTEPLMPRGLRIFLQADEDAPLEAKAAGVPEPIQDGEFHGPHLFDFNWREFPSPPIPPLMRRETFIEYVGPTINATSNPYETFVKIWDRPIMEHIAAQTNLYAQEYASCLLERGNLGPRSRITTWVDTDVDELYTYFGLVIAMGIIIKSKIEDYWNTDKTIFWTPGFSVNMPLKRFQLLARCLHFNDNARFSSNNPTCSEAKIYKIQPIVRHLNLKFSSLYRLGQNIAVDESLVMWKGPLHIKQFNNKAAKVGIKTYEVCDSQTGYLWRFELYAGGEAKTEPNRMLMTGAIPNLVLRLLRGLDRRGHTVWMDNYYNSPALARVLKSLGFDCVGTLRTNRQFVPDYIDNLRKSDMSMGQVCGCTSGDVDLLVWRDQNRVAMITTYHGGAMSGDKPVAIKDYNTCMGGVDKKDQMISMYPMERRRTQIWYKKFFRRLLNVSILNAYIIHKHFNPKMQHREFRMGLVTELLQRHNQQRPEKGLEIVSGVPKFSSEVIAHFPSEYPMLPGGSKVGKRRRRCVVCKNRTMNYCKACNAALCFSFTKTDISCFIMYHT